MEADTRVPRRFMLSLFAALVLGLILLLAVPGVFAKQEFMSEFGAAYPAAAGSQLDSCLLCHSSATNPGEGNLNAYGRDWENEDIGDERFLAAALVNRDSDGDGVTNAAEIAQLSLPGDPASNTAPTTTTTLPGTAPDGQALYAARCAGCHGPDGGNLKGTALARAAFISITLNGRGGMPPTASLTEVQAGAIWDFVTGKVAPTTTTTAPGATTTTTRAASGASIWSSQCASCHGPSGGNVVPTSLSRSQLISVITNGTGSMRGFAELGSAQIGNVADYLIGLSARAPATTTTATAGGAVDGPTLYMQFCSGCHGLHGDGGPGGALLEPLGRSEIITVTAGGTDSMPGFESQLSATEIEAIADHVLTFSSQPTRDEESTEKEAEEPEPEPMIEYVIVTVPVPEPVESDAPSPLIPVAVAFIVGLGTGGGVIGWTRLGKRLFGGDGAES